MANANSVKKWRRSSTLDYKKNNAAKKGSENEKVN